jgi:hypothetical protein
LHSIASLHNIHIVFLLIKCSPYDILLLQCQKYVCFRKLTRFCGEKNDFSLSRALFFNIIILEALNKCINNGLGTVVFL